MNPSKLHSQQVPDRIDTENPPFGIIFIRKVFIFLAVLFTIHSLVTIGAYFLDGKNEGVLGDIFQTIIFWIIVYGFLKTKRWIVVFVLLCSYFWLAIGSIDFFYMRPTSHFELFQKIVKFAFLIFCAFQIYIFSKRETKIYFNDKGKTLIS